VAANPFEVTSLRPRARRAADRQAGDRGRARASSWTRSCTSSPSTPRRSRGCPICCGKSRPGATPARSTCGARPSSAIRRRCARASCAWGTSTATAFPTRGARSPPTNAFAASSPTIATRCRLCPSCTWTKATRSRRCRSPSGW
jgi:hypothetical protein